MSGHSETVISYGSFSAPVDDGIVPLILAIWRHGIPTSMSCESDDDDRVWVMFPDARAAEHFLSLVCVGDDDASDLECIRCRVAPDLEPVDADAYKERCWKLSVKAYDDGYVDLPTTDGDEDDLMSVFAGAPSLTLAVSIRFPQGDLATVCDRLRP